MQKLSFQHTFKECLKYYYIFKRRKNYTSFFLNNYYMFKNTLYLYNC